MIEVSRRIASALGRWNEFRPTIDPKPPPSWIARTSPSKLSSVSNSPPGTFVRQLADLTWNATVRGVEKQFCTIAR